MNTMPTYATNKKARFDYTILETFEAGIVLLGHEVKSVRNGHVNLTGSYVTFHGLKPALTNARISPYPFASNLESYDPERSRPLLLGHQEITYLKGKITEESLTIVPLSLYAKGRHIKIEIGLARGKKTYDKRETIKKREVDREIKRNIEK